MTESLYTWKMHSRTSHYKPITQLLWQKYIKVARNFKKIQFTFTIQLYTVYKCYIKDPDVITYSYSIAAVVGCSVIQKYYRKSLVCFRWRPKKIKKTTKQKENLENQKTYDGMVLPRLMGLYQMPSALASLIVLPFRAPSSHSVQEKCVSCCSRCLRNVYLR